MTLAPSTRPVGALLREWRERRRLSQLELALATGVSARHLSFVETGRSQPTPAMILRLTEQLDVPLRERNQLLLAGGYAPAYPQHHLRSPELASITAALRQVLDAHRPLPALVTDRWWEMVDANDALEALIDGCAAQLLEAPVNVLRLSLHPDGLAPRIRNLPEWRGHLLQRLRRRIDATADARLRELEEELRGYPGGMGVAPAGEGVVLPMRLELRGRELALFSLSAAVETAGDVTVQELAVETFYPADGATATVLRGDRVT